MAVEQSVILLSRVLVGAVVTLLAILLWSRTRDTAWMFVIIGSIAAYGETIFTTLESFGLVRGDILVISGVSLVRPLFVNLPALFYGIAFIIMIVRKRLR